MTQIERKELRSPQRCDGCGIGVRTVAQLDSWDDDNWTCPSCLVEMLDGQDVEIAYQDHEELMSTDPNKEV